jgi:enoyl-CoA hydratase/carnithine racemase
MSARASVAHITALTKTAAPKGFANVIFNLSGSFLPIFGRNGPVHNHRGHTGIPELNGAYMCRKSAEIGQEMIELETEGGVWIATIRRPDKANSLTASMLADLGDIARRAKGQARALVLTGEGRVFSAGADLDEARAGLATSDLWEELSGAIAALPCLTIAALNGTLAGGAFGMALACDLRLSVPEARFFYPVMRLGFLPQPSDPGRLAALVGPARASLLLMAGAKVEAPEALAWGLVDRLVAPDALLAEARALAADALAADPGHAAAIKAMIRAARAG